MTVEEKSEATQVVVEVAVTKEEVLKEEKEMEKVQQVKDVIDGEECKEGKMVEKSSSYREESNFPSDLKEFEKKALNDLKSKLEEAILGNKLFKKEVAKEAPKVSPKKEGEVKKEETEEAAKEGEEKVEEKKDGKEEEEGDEEKKTEENTEEKSDEKNGEESEKADVDVEVDKDIFIWGVPLLASKGHEGTDVVLLKFLRARDFKVNEAFEMLKKTLQWRKELNIDLVLDEELGADLASVTYMNGVDREGRPICYNIFGVLDDAELYKKTFGTEEKRTQFLRWRVQLMEKGIQKLDFKPGGVNSLLQINDLKNSPGPSRKEVRVATKQAVALLQDNYPEFAAKNIFINVPFWYYAFHALLSPFLTQRTKSKFIIARPAKVTETLLKYIPIQEIPIQYGGLKRDVDFEFSTADGEASEIVIKGGSTEIVEIPAPEIGTTFVWDLTVVGWEVSYKEEFVPTDENSYTIIVQKEKKLASNEEPIRKTFKNHEPGKILLNIQNSSSKKKKAFYRYKIKKSSF
ncbi:patellin-4 [Coffea eugenioides]|uniref:patellin-4 n=1 Tax=Coffea eugenioides TaxID=49369 RepID=UPI000F608A41|nr:patellin-4 [Coffea eugenioides]